MLESGEFVMNRNAVEDIGVENLEAANDASPRYAQEGGPADGIYEQNDLKLRRARSMAPARQPVDYVGNMSKDAFLKSDYMAGESYQRQQRVKNEPIYEAFKYNVWLKHHSPMAKEKQKADLVIHNKNMLKYGAYNKLFKLDATADNRPPKPPPPPMGDIFTPVSEQIKNEYVGNIPNPNQIMAGAQPVKSSANLDRKTPQETRELESAKQARWAERRRMIYESKRQPRPNDMIQAGKMSQQPRGSEAQQLGALLDKYRVAETGMTFDDFKMDNPVAYETLKKGYSMAFSDMSGDMTAFEYDNERKREAEKLNQKEMQPHYDFIKNRHAQLTEQAAEDSHFKQLVEREKFDAQSEIKLTKVANFGLPGWESGLPRIAVQSMVNAFGDNNVVEKDWVDGKYDDAQKEQYTLSGGDLSGDTQSYIDAAMGSLKQEPGQRHIKPEQLRERAQNLRHLVSTVAEEKGFYSAKNPTGISPEQLGEMNTMIDDSYNFAMQGYQTPREVENARLEVEMAAKTRQEAIDNMEAKDAKLKKKKSSKLAEFAGELLFGQTGGYVSGYQEGGSVSLNNSRRLFNLARRRYA